MATVFETRLIGNIGKDAVCKNLENGLLAISFPVAHNKQWKDKRSGERKTKTTWVNCTIWKKENSNVKILDFLTTGTLVEVLGTPIAKAYTQEDGSLRTEIRLNVSKTNILRPGNKKEDLYDSFSMDDEPDFDFDEE